MAARAVRAGTAGLLLGVAVSSDPSIGAARAQQQISPQETVVTPSSEMDFRAGDSATEEQLRAAIQARPGDAALHAQLAELLLASNRAVDAHAAYLKASELDPRNAEVRYGLASAALALGRVAEAETQYAWGAQLDPTDPGMQIGLGEAALAGGHPELAAPRLRRAMELADSGTPTRARAETLLLQAERELSDFAGPGLTGLAGRSLFYGSVGALVVLGFLLLIPVAEGLLLLLVMTPLMALRRRDEP